MAQTTIHPSPAETTEDDLRQRERLRSAVPVAVAVSLLFGLVVTGALLLRTVLDFGIWFLTSS